jgi:hypothetical protein
MTKFILSNKQEFEDITFEIPSCDVGIKVVTTAEHSYNAVVGRTIVY